MRHRNSESLRSRHSPNKHLWTPLSPVVFVARNTRDDLLALRPRRDTTYKSKQNSTHQHSQTSSPWRNHIPPSSTSPSLPPTRTLRQRCRELLPEPPQSGYFAGPRALLSQTMLICLLPAALPPRQQPPFLLYPLPLLKTATVVTLLRQHTTPATSSMPPKAASKPSAPTGSRALQVSPTSTSCDPLPALAPRLLLATAIVPRRLPLLPSSHNPPTDPSRP